MIKRIRLYREGVPTLDGRMLRETTWAPTPIPLLIEGKGDAHSRIIGTVVHIRRGTDGWVTGVIQSQFEAKGYYAQADFDMVERLDEYSTDEYITFDARLRAVTLGDRPAWKEMTQT